MMRITKKLIAGLAALMIFNGTTVLACPECRVQVKSGIYNGDFVSNLFIILLPILVLVVIGIGILFADRIKAKLRGRTDRWLTPYNAHH